jgi:8-oxo-dGTP diphosphatase
VTAHRVAAGVFLREGHVLLCHRRPTREWYADCWDLPGGHLEPGESGEEALARECAEELGVRVRDVRRHAAELDLPGVDLHLFVVDAWDGDVVNAAPEEHDDLGWFTADELASLVLADQRYLDVLPRLLEATPDAG